MPRRLPQRAQPVTAGTSNPPPSPSSAPVELTAEQVQRWAAMIADGRSDFPDDLATPDRESLLAEVRGQLRNRLARYVARAIAARIHRERGSAKEA